MYGVLSEEHVKNRVFHTVYAGEPLSVAVPEENLLNVVEPHAQLPLMDPEGTLRALLEDPIDGEKLVDLVKPSDKVALISSEYMRMPYTWILAHVGCDLRKGSECIAVSVRYAHTLSASARMSSIVTCRSGKPASYSSMARLITSNPRM